MAQIQFIKYLRDREDHSIREIAKKLNVDWRTAKKYADREDWNHPFPRSKRRHPIMEPFIPIVDAWLLEDRTVPKKQRHTAKRIYDRLVQEYGFTGSERTVRYYVANRKTELKLEDAQAYVRLEHPGGEAQVDFGTVYAVIGGRQQQLKQLTLSFPYSNAAFPYLLPAENTECFLEGLKRIFERIGGIPSKLWFDNLSAAVIAVESNGKRKLTEAFERFALHYRFEAVFCNPGKGNEKGNVENKVGYTRRNWCVPIPVCSDLDELQSQLNQQAIQDMERLHYAKKKRIRDLWEEESTKLLRLPIVPYEAVRLEPVKVNPYGEIKLDGELFPLPGAQPGQMVLLRIGWNSADVLDKNYNKLATFPRPYMNQAIPIDWVKMLRVFRFKPRSLPYAAVFKLLPTSIRDWLMESVGATQKERLEWLLRMLHTYPIDRIDQVLQQPNADLTAMEHRLYRLQHPEPSFAPIADVHTPSVLLGREPEMSAYDRLTRAVIRR